jgi:hypothetical protein
VTGLALHAGQIGPPAGGVAREALGIGALFALESVERLGVWKPLPARVLGPVTDLALPGPDVVRRDGDGAGQRQQDRRSGA